MRGGMRGKSARKPRFFPQGFDGFMRQRAQEGGGVLLLGCGFLLALALATYTESDPNLNHATRQVAQNWLGRPGAYLSDLLLQTLGLSAWLFVGLLATWGFRVASHRGLPRWWLNIALVPLTLLLFAAFAAALPLPASWTLRTGLGGILGDWLMYRQLVPVAVELGLPISAVLPGAACLGLACICFYFCSGLSLGEWRSVGSGIGFGASAAAGLTAQGIYQGGKAAIRAGAEAPGFFGSIKQMFGAAFAPIFARRAVDAEDDDFETPVPNEDKVRGSQQRTEPRLTPKSRPVDDEEEADDDEDERESMVLPPAKKLDEQGMAAVSNCAGSRMRACWKACWRISASRARSSKCAPARSSRSTNSSRRPASSRRVIGLADDIARSMSALAARVAVVPGRNAIGIELPNAKRETVYLRELLASGLRAVQGTSWRSRSGKTINGER
jgi:S-DNA-T family DNA segregation ATPase FtsK/SpoIIIE